MGIYSYGSQPTGIYASTLEAAWASRFKAWDWEARYIGSVCYWADFEIDDVQIEVKPEGEDFIEAAARRASGKNILIISGDPGWATWWFRDKTLAFVEMEPGPHALGRETFKEFISRIGYRFE